MNYKIVQRLADQASTTTTWYERGYSKYTAMDRYKFCELIVKECMDTIERVGTLNQDDNYTMYINALKEKFDEAV